MSEKTTGRALGDPEKNQGFAGALLILQVLLYCATHVIFFGAPKWNEWSDQSFWVAILLGCLGVPLVVRRSWSSACLLMTAGITIIVIWPCLFSEWSGAGARVLAFVVLVGGTWGFLRLGLQLALHADISVFLACMLLGGIAIGIDALYIKSVRLFMALLVFLILIRILIWVFRSRSLNATIFPVLFLFVGTIGLTLALTNWLHTVPEQRPFTLAYIAIVALPLSAWLSKIPFVASKHPSFRLGIQILVAGSLLTLALSPLVQSWLNGEFDFVGAQP